MQILTLDDADFPDLMRAWSDGRRVGSFTRDGKVQVVTVTPRLVLILSESTQDRIAIKPARSVTEAENVAREILERARERGNEVWEEG